MKVYSTKIQEYRKAKGLTQEEFANLLKVSRQLVSKWETGDSTPNSDDLKTLSIILNVEMNNLLSDCETKKLNPKKKKKLVLGSLIIGFSWLIAIIIIISIGIVQINKFDESHDYLFEFSIENDSCIGDYAVLETVQNTNDGVVNVPSSYNGYPVKKISNESFRKYVKYDVEYIKLPKSIKWIEYGSFRDCINLKDINIPYGIEVLDVETFAYCESIENIVIPNSVLELKSNFYIGVFSGCSSLKTIVIPSSIDVINENCFSGVDALEIVYFGGDEAEWLKLVNNKEKNNDALDSVQVYYYSEEEPNVINKYWYFNNGKPQIW